MVKWTPRDFGVRQEYLHNMIDSDYMLVIRGAGNASFRLFETLCSGRIPVLVDTDCVLPYEEQVDWKQYCVWVDQTELPYIAEKVATSTITCRLKTLLIYNKRAARSGRNGYRQKAFSNTSICIFRRFDSHANSSQTAGVTRRRGAASVSSVDTTVSLGAKALG